MIDNIDFDKIIRSPWVAGGLGAVVALKGTPGATWLERLFNVLCGVLIAGFVGPAAADYLALTTPNMQSVVNFVCGLFGMNVIALVTSQVRDSRLSDWLPWLRRKEP